MVQAKCIMNREELITIEGNDMEDALWKATSWLDQVTSVEDGDKLVIEVTKVKENNNL